MFYEQTDFDIHCEWGMSGIEKLSPISEVAIIVDVMSFSTCVDIAVNNSACVYPYRWKDKTAIEMELKAALCKCLDNHRYFQQKQKRD